MTNLEKALALVPTMLKNIDQKLERESCALKRAELVTVKNLLINAALTYPQIGSLKMLHEKKAKSVIRKMIRKAKQDWTTAIYIIDPYEEENLVEDSSQLERDLLNAVFGVDESHIRFINMTTGQYLGGAHIVL